MYIISIIYIVKIEICFCAVISSILKKVSSYPEKFKDHIYIPGKTKNDENTYYIKSCKMLGSTDLIEVGGHSIGGQAKYELDSLYQKTNIKLNNHLAEFRLAFFKFLYAKESISADGYKTNGISDKPHKSLGPDKKLTDKVADNLFDTKERLENWKYNVFNTKLPVFISILFTFNSSNNFSNILPWLVDKQYTDDEINKLFNFTDKEIKFIDYVIKKYERYSLWNKRYITGDTTITDSEIKNSLI